MTHGCLSILLPIAKLGHQPVSGAARIDVGLTALSLSTHEADIAVRLWPIGLAIRLSKMTRH